MGNQLPRYQKISKTILRRNGYELLDMIYEGHYYHIYTVRDMDLGALNDVTILSIDNLSMLLKMTKEQMDGLLEQNETILNHMNSILGIPRLLDIIQEQSLLFYVYEKISGITLESYIQNHNNVEMDEEIIIVVLKQILNIIHEIHLYDHVYGKLTITNIYILNDGYTVYIAPSNILSAINDTKLSQLLCLLESNNRDLLPDINNESLRLSPNRDVWGIGIVLIQMLTGINHIKSIDLKASNSFKIIRKYFKSQNKPSIFLPFIKKCLEINNNERISMNSLLKSAIFKNYDISVTNIKNRLSSQTQINQLINEQTRLKDEITQLKYQNYKLSMSLSKLEYDSDITNKDVYINQSASLAKKVKYGFLGNNDAYHIHCNQSHYKSKFIDRNNRDDTQIEVMMKDVVNGSEEISNLLIDFSKKSTVFLEWFFRSAMMQIHVTKIYLNQSYVGLSGAGYFSECLYYLTNITILALKMCHFDDNCVKLFAPQLKRLRNLDLLCIKNKLTGGYKMSDVGLQSVIDSVKYLSNFRTFIIDNNLFTLQGLRDIIYLTNLKQLNLGANPNIKDDTVQYIIDSSNYLSKLQWLFFDRTSVSDISVDVMYNNYKRFPKLVYCDFHNNPQLTDPNLKLFRKFIPEDHQSDKLDFHDYS